MAVPQHHQKHDGRAYVTPHALLAYRAELGIATDPAPAAVICCWQASLFAQVRSERTHRRLHGPGEVLLGLAGSAGELIELDSGVGVCLLPIGAPAAAIVLEELAALGTTQVIGVGAAGGLSPELSPGDAVVCTAALRDEGTSHHYLAPARFAQPDPTLREALSDTAKGAARGPTWSTDAPYRETLEEIAAYRDEGILTVDMEAAALFAVAERLEVRAASLFCVSDVLSGEHWAPHFGARDVDAALRQCFGAAEAAIAATAR
ncbi:MAG: nucleoside phosphorylase [Actinomycetota bacterium]|nr:nucleoside phosphorylase [Actinomycetota bacterium]